MLVFLNNLWGLGRVGIGLLYRPARLHWLAELVPWNRFLDSIILKNEDEDDFFLDQNEEAKYIHTSTFEGTKKNEFIRS